jgi:hypothetical protein
MKEPCELIVWYILPAVRAELASALVARGMSQKEIAWRLGITQAAVSQYISKKRGNGANLGEEAKVAIMDLADEMKNGELNILLKICDICSIIRKSGQLCTVHKEVEEVPANCNACMRELPSEIPSTADA